jgi:Uncharacterized protein conserved in bacteria (DUF2332)
VAELAQWYAWFAAYEAAGRSPLYREITRGVAGDADVLSSLCELPRAKRQPTLLLAAVRHVAGLVSDWPAFRDSHHARGGERRSLTRRSIRA